MKKTLGALLLSATLVLLPTGSAQAATSTAQTTAVTYTTVYIHTATAAQGANSCKQIGGQVVSQRWFITNFITTCRAPKRNPV